MYVGDVQGAAPQGGRSEERGMSSSRALEPKIPMPAYHVAAGHDPLEEPPV
jgi:hypothetical protein